MPPAREGPDFLAGWDLYRLTTIGRVIVIMLMFIGRLGPITVFAALSGPEKKQTLAYPDEEPWIG